ncbi:hypothetical protein COU60_01590 [Candidatus Pacearchaeota archaeon CG10_big_fil_rev_8_21_14_0_10_34_76]|nr:MAG: hypothetical protein COU60_01590 [Candidatus Pacearchaeota archaeon CG10_big_fil_rev_8_21_14_0_10_34_76]
MTSGRNEGGFIEYIQMHLQKVYMNLIVAGSREEMASEFVGMRREQLCRAMSRGNLRENAGEVYDCFMEMYSSSA